MAHPDAGESPRLQGVSEEPTGLSEVHTGLGLLGFPSGGLQVPEWKVSKKNTNKTVPVLIHS